MRSRREEKNRSSAKKAEKCREKKGNCGAVRFAVLITSNDYERFPCSARSSLG
jgi:hypothetical protein